MSTHMIASPLSNKEDSALDPCIALSREGMSSEPATERVGECAVGYVHSHTGGRQTVRAYRACREKTCVCARQARPCMRCHRGGQTAEPGGSEGIEGYAYSEGSSEAKDGRIGWFLEMGRGHARRHWEIRLRGRSIRRVSIMARLGLFDISTRVPRPIIPVRHGVLDLRSQPGRKKKEEDALGRHDDPPNEADDGLPSEEMGPSRAHTT